MQPKNPIGLPEYATPVPDRDEERRERERKDNAETDSGVAYNPTATPGVCFCGAKGLLMWGLCEVCAR